VDPEVVEDEAVQEERQTQWAPTLDRGTQKLLDDSLKLVNGGVHHTSQQQGDEWEVQSPEQILEEVRQTVQTRKPWRELADDSLLEKKSLVDKGAHIPLPDIRVRLMEDELSLRVRCELLDEPIPPLAPVKKSPKIKPKETRKVQTPWYIPAKKWYELQDKSENPEEGSANFPYANLIWNLSDKKEEPSEAKQLAQFNKETLSMVESYKQFMKGNRLPHFLL
jgi:hypothetical protein